jgi:hypothetical protein
MVLSKKLLASALGGLLIAASFAPAWAADASNAAPANQSGSTVSGDQSVLAAISPLLADTKVHKAPVNCKADSLYSNHDVIGDPDACLLSHVDVRAAGAASNPGISGSL